MALEITKALMQDIRQTVRLHEITLLADKIEMLYRQGEITKEEQKNLLESHKQQLKLILDLNLLPERARLAMPLADDWQEQSTPKVAKSDSAEITLEAFQLIEQEAIRLNFARLQYIQDNFYTQVIQTKQKTKSLTDNKGFSGILKRLIPFMKTK